MKVLRMMKKSALFVLALGMTVGAYAAPRPNIVHIVADDLG